MVTVKPAPLDARAYRDTVGLFATGVAVIAAQMDGELSAMTANAVSSLSLDPMLVMFAPGKKTKFASSLDGLSSFTINFLRSDQQALSTYFAGGWKLERPPPFRFVDTATSVRLEGSLASLECARHHLLDVGDHWLVVGSVTGLHQGIKPHDPLLFFGGRYRSLDVTDIAPAPDLSDVHDEPAHIFYPH